MQLKWFMSWYDEEKGWLKHLFHCDTSKFIHGTYGAGKLIEQLN